MKLNLYLAKTTMISNLDYTFNHFDKNAVSVIQSSQVIRLFSLISEDFTLEKIANARSIYHIEILKTLGVKSFQE